MHGYDFPEYATAGPVEREVLDEVAATESRTELADLLGWATYNNQAEATE